jgi:hypothetical protein
MTPAEWARVFETAKRTLENTPTGVLMSDVVCNYLLAALADECRQIAREGYYE